MSLSTRLTGLMARMGIRSASSATVDQLKELEKQDPQAMAEIAANYSSRGIALETILESTLPDDLKFALLAPHLGVNHKNVHERIDWAQGLRDICVAAGEAFGGKDGRRAASFVGSNTQITHARSVLLEARAAAQDATEIVTALPMGSDGSSARTLGGVTETTYKNRNGGG